jgi:hypothetical protein
MLRMLKPLQLKANNVAMAEHLQHPPRTLEVHEPIQPDTLKTSGFFALNEGLFNWLRHAWETGWETSGLMAGLGKFASRHVTFEPLNETDWLLGVIPAVGTLALLWGCTTLGTGLIGASRYRPVKKCFAWLGPQRQLA